MKVVLMFYIFAKINKIGKSIDRRYYVIIDIIICVYASARKSCFEL